MIFLIASANQWAATQQASASANAPGKQVCLVALALALMPNKFGIASRSATQSPVVKIGDTQSQAKTRNSRNSRNHE